jgi:hypothetical protein
MNPYIFSFQKDLDIVCVYVVSAFGVGSTIAIYQGGLGGEATAMFAVISLCLAIAGSVLFYTRWKKQLQHSFRFQSSSGQLFCISPGLYKQLDVNEVRNYVDETFEAYRSALGLTYLEFDNLFNKGPIWIDIQDEYLKKVTEQDGVRPGRAMSGVTRSTDSFSLGVPAHWTPLRSTAFQHELGHIILWRHFETLNPDRDHQFMQKFGLS